MLKKTGLFVGIAIICISLLLGTVLLKRYPRAVGPLDTLGVMGTPTLLRVDDRGIVQWSWADGLAPASALQLHRL